MACDFCLRLPRVPFEFDHPAAIEVAMATQTSAEQGQLDLNPAVLMDRAREIRLSEVSARHLVAQWVRSRPAQGHPQLRCTLEVVFVDVDETCWLDIRLGEILPADPRNGPADIRLMTTKVGFFQLREIGLVKCEQLQWAAVEDKRADNRIGIAPLFSIHSSSNAANHLIREVRTQPQKMIRPNEQGHPRDLAVSSL